MTGGLSFEGKFKFSGDGTGNQSALNQGGMILGFFTYEKNPPRTDFTPRSTSRSSPATSKTPHLNQISTNVFNGSHDLTIYDTMHKHVIETSLTTHCPIRTSPLPNAEYHTYKFEWFPNWINFYIDDKLLRTVTNPNSLPDPSRDQRLHLNIWGQGTDMGPANGDWTGNPVGDPSLGPARSGPGQDLLR